MSERCPSCKSTDVTKYTPGIFGDSRHRCNSCGTISFTSDFVEPTLFVRLTSSPEVLAEKLVYQFVAYDSHGLFVSCWKSTITEESYRTKTEAFDATVDKLKEVAK
jgi:hypothetical protein